MQTGKDFPSNFNVEDCREFLRQNGLYVQQLWDYTTVVDEAKEMGHTIDKEEAINIMDNIGECHDESLCPTIQVAIEIHFKNKNS